MADVTEEFMHAQQLGRRIKQLGGLVPGSAAVKLGNQIQPSDNTTDVVGVIKAVIEAEEKAVPTTRRSSKRPTAKITSRKTCAFACWLTKKSTSSCSGDFLKEYESA